MYSFLIVVSIVIAVLLVIVILLQSSKGGGLAGSFGGAGGFGTVFGTRRTADLLSKITWWLAAMLVILAVVINLFFLPGRTETGRESIIQKNNTQQTPSSNSMPFEQNQGAPNQPTQNP